MYMHVRGDINGRTFFGQKGYTETKPPKIKINLNISTRALFSLHFLNSQTCLHVFQVSKESTSTCTCCQRVINLYERIICIIKHVVTYKCILKQGGSSLLDMPY